MERNKVITLSDIVSAKIKLDKSPLPRRKELLLRGNCIECFGTYFYHDTHFNIYECTGCKALYSPAEVTVIKV